MALQLRHHTTFYMSIASILYGTGVLVVAILLHVITVMYSSTVENTRKSICRMSYDDEIRVPVNRILQEGPAQARSSRYLWHRWALTPAVLRLAWCDNFSDFVDPTEPARSFFVSKFFSLSANSVSKIKVSANFVSKFLLSANQIVVSKFCKQISKFDCRKQIVSAIQQIAP
jgi:hypothetical protein